MQLSTFHYTPEQGWNQPLDQVLDSETTWLIVFGGSAVSPLMQGFADLRQAFPKSVWTGCSTSGEIHGNLLLDHSLVVAVLKFEHTLLRLASASIDSAEVSHQVGAQLGKELSAPDLKAVFLVTDGLSVNGSKLIDGLSTSIGPDVVVTGGMAGDGDRFQSTWVIHEQAPQANHVTAIGLYGDKLGVSHGSKGGWDLLGPERKITGSQGNVLFSIDSQPALSLYKTYLGERADGLPATGLLFPLAILNENKVEGMTVRTILAVSKADNSITFAGDVPVGSTVRLMRANFERLINGAGEAAAIVNFKDYSGGPLLSIGISCIGRRLVLGQRTEEEIEEVRHVLPLGSDLIGFYSYGEISPLASGRCDLHNQTMTLSSFWEK
jgi:hypothetical protein